MSDTQAPKQPFDFSGQSTKPDPGLTTAPMTRWRAGQVVAGEDSVVVEAPLEIVVADRPLAVLLRTPGEDLDLVAGYLATEGLIADAADLRHLAHCTDPNRPAAQNRVVVQLAAGVSAARVNAARREGWATASCGACGKTRIEQVLRDLPPRGVPGVLSPAAVWAAAVALEGVQPRFGATGGLHAAALVDAAGAVVAAAEDIGRHNAVDKVLGACLRADRWPLAELSLVVSSRAGFEIVHKALAGQVGAVIAVGAASSLAIELARAARVALYAFVRPGRMNRYA